MSTSGLTQNYQPNTLDGLNVIEADQIYLDGQLVDLNNFVPYIGATQVLNMGAFAIQTSHIPSSGNDVVNYTTLVNAISNQDTTNFTTFLDKITNTPQTVQSSTTFLSGLTTSDDRPVTLGSRVVVGANYQSTLTSANVSVGQYFGTITSSGSTYQSTSTGSSPPILILFPITAGKRYTLTIEVLGDDSTYDTTLDLYQSQDNVSPYPNFNDATLDSPLFAPASTVFHQTNATFVATTTGSVVVNLTTLDPSGVSTVKWKNMFVYEMGVALENVSMPSQLADRVVVLNDKKQLVASGINTTKLGYLDNVSSDIQTQLNGKLNLSGGTMTGTLAMGANKITTTYTPVNAEDVITKGYGDSAYATTSALSGYLPLTGGTLTGALTVQNTVNTSISGINANITPALNLVSTANHFNSASAQTYLFNAPSGEIQLSYSTTRNATTATLLLGAPSTDISEIVSISGDGTTNLPMNFLASRYAFLTGNVGIGTTNANGNLQFTNAIVSRKIVLYEGANNNHQFLGFGVNNNTLRYQVNGTADNHVFFTGTSSTTSTELMRIQGDGKVGIGTNAPSGRLTIHEATGTGPSVNPPQAGLVFSHGNTNGSQSILFTSANNFTSDFGFIQFIDTVAVAPYTQYNYFGGSGAEVAALVIGCQNDGVGAPGPDSVIIASAGIVLDPTKQAGGGVGSTYIVGNVGIGITNPSSPLVIQYGGGEGQYIVLKNPSYVGGGFTGIQFNHADTRYARIESYLPGANRCHLRFYTSDSGGTQTNRLEITDTGASMTGTLLWPTTGSNSGLMWGVGYSRIVDDGNLRIATDDTLHFYTGSNTSTYGTERMRMDSGITRSYNRIYIGTAGDIGSQLSIQDPTSGRINHFGYAGDNYIGANNTYFDGVVVHNAPHLINPNSSVSYVGNGVLQIRALPNTSYGGRAQDAISCIAWNDGNFIIPFFNSAGGFRGTIAGVNSSSVSYNTSSDRRLKDHVHTIEDSLSIVNRLNPVHFRWIRDDEWDFGFIAQDVYKVLPQMRPNLTNYIKDCTCERKGMCCGELCAHCQSMNDEPVDENGEPKYYSLDYGKFTPYLVGAVKELSAQVEVLQAREAVWVEHAKQQELEIHKAHKACTAMNTAMKKMEADIQKLASIVSQLISTK